MNNFVDFSVDIDKDLYEQVERLFDKFGLSFEEAALLFIREVARLGRLPLELTEEDWDIVKKLKTADVEAECTDARYSSKDVLEAMKAEIEKSVEEGV